MQTGRARLRQWLERSKLNQREGARVIGMDFTHLNQILTGQRRPGLDTAVKIEHSTGIVVEAWVPFDVDKVETTDSTDASTTQDSKA